MYMLEAMDYLLLVVMPLEDLTVAVKDMQVVIPSLVTAAAVLLIFVLTQTAYIIELSSQAAVVAVEKTQVTHMVTAVVLVALMALVARIMELKPLQEVMEALVSVLEPIRVTAAEAEQFVDRTFGGSLPGFLAAFMSGKKLTAREAEEVKRLIDQYREE